MSFHTKSWPGSSILGVYWAWFIEGKAIKTGIHWWANRREYHGFFTKSRHGIRACQRLQISWKHTSRLRVLGSLTVCFGSSSCFSPSVDWTTMFVHWNWSVTSESAMFHGSNCSRFSQHLHHFNHHFLLHLLKYIPSGAPGPLICSWPDQPSPPWFVLRTLYLGRSRIVTRHGEHFGVFEPEEMMIV